MWNVFVAGFHCNLNWTCGRVAQPCSPMLAAWQGSADSCTVLACMGLHVMALGSEWELVRWLVPPMLSDWQLYDAAPYRVLTTGLTTTSYSACCDPSEAAGPGKPRVLLHNSLGSFRARQVLCWVMGSCGAHSNLTPECVLPCSSWQSCGARQPNSQVCLCPAGLTGKGEGSNTQQGDP